MRGVRAQMELGMKRSAGISIKTRHRPHARRRRLGRGGIGLFAVGAVIVGTGATVPQSASAAGGGGEWQLDETSGNTAVDSSGNGHDGTVRGDVGMGAPGHQGSAFDFHAPGSWVEVDSSDSLNPDTEDFTVSAWVNVDNTPGSGQVYDVVRKGLPGSTGGEFDLQIVNHGYVRCIAKDSDRTRSSITGPRRSVTDGQWHHIGCVRSGSSWQVTVDDTTRSTRAGLGSIDNTKSLAIGSSYGNGNEVRGLVDDVQLSLTASSEPPPPPPSGSRFGAHWTFSEVGSPPSELADSSGNNNDGTPLGGVVGDGSSFRFNGNGRVEVPDSPTLNPGVADFSYTVVFTTTLPAAGTDYDLLRKGFASTTGGEFKVEVVNARGVARAFCLVKDNNKHVARIRGGRATLADGQQHTVTCSKTSSGVTIKVDGLAPKTGTASGGLGQVANTAPLTIGAKANSGGDFFIGTMTDALLN